MSDDVLRAGEVRLLAEIGYVAVGRGLHGEAERIFAAVAAARPASAAAGIGRAMMALSRGAHDEAVGILERQALAAEPDSIEARQIMVLALGLAGRAGERERRVAELAGLGAEVPDRV